ncbi:MAG: hypothetical protein Q4B85_14175, partial [Lachnospiraceae bacterium]|nr:hypothetical protein [Lachnospiraceae bacterium]
LTKSAVVHEQVAKRIANVCFTQFPGKQKQMRTCTLFLDFFILFSQIHASIKIYTGIPDYWRCTREKMTREGEYDGSIKNIDC